MPAYQIAATVAFAGALGALARFGSVLLAAKFWGDSFPYGTLLVNVVGCLAMGLAAAALPLGKEEPAEMLRYGFMVGFLGAFTTFSAFSLETLKQFQTGNSGLALLNVATNILLCLLAVWLGQRVGQAVW